MRLFRQGFSSFRKHVYLCNGIYYFRIDVPSDLAHHFPAAEIKRSLKTNDPDVAKLAAKALELKALQAYAMLRLGLQSEDIIKQIVGGVMPETRKPTVPANKGKQISNVIKTYTAEKQSGWTDKTKLEVAGVSKMLVDILGNVDVATINRPMLIELRESLLRVPPHFYIKKNGSSR